MAYLPDIPRETFVLSVKWHGWELRDGIVYVDNEPVVPAFRVENGKSRISYKGTIAKAKRVAEYSGVRGAGDAG